MADDEVLYQGSLVASVEAPAMARGIVEATLRTVGASGATKEVGALLISELVANAVLHAEGVPVLTVARGGPDVVHLGVTDGAPDRLPEARPAPQDASSGRGLLLVGWLAQRWWVEADAASKTVWCALDLTIEAPT